MSKRHKRAVVWLRRDLRLAENSAISRAVKSAEEVAFLYIHDEFTSKWFEGGAQRWWLHHSLKSIEKSIKDIGGRLFIYKGCSEDVIESFVKDYDISLLCFNKLYDPCLHQSQNRVEEELCNKGIEVSVSNDTLLFNPEVIKNGQGLPYKVYTPFFKACQSQIVEKQVGRKVGKIVGIKKKVSSLTIEDLHLLPKMNWADHWPKYWTPGEDGAMRTLRWFLKNGVLEYEKMRDYPFEDGVSMLSPHLQMGEISPRQVWIETIKSQKVHNANSKIWPFLRQLIWREFAYHLLAHFPDTTEKPLQKQFIKFPWKTDKKRLKAWQMGLTGYPIVDAGMRQLWQTGWMHNRLRMIVGSFLVKDLLISWQEGAKWFWDTLVDADLANNTLGWQWVGGCGADAAPYFRIFNPILQGEKFDKDGDYVRKWVPELKKISNKFIHKPWDAPEMELLQAGVTLGEDYPYPIVDHAKARDVALEALSSIKKG